MGFILNSLYMIRGVSVCEVLCAAKLPFVRKYSGLRFVFRGLIMGFILNSLYMIRCISVCEVLCAAKLPFVRCRS